MNSERNPETRSDLSLQLENLPSIDGHVVSTFSELDGLIKSKIKTLAMVVQPKQYDEIDTLAKVARALGAVGCQQLLNSQVSPKVAMRTIEWLTLVDDGVWDAAPDRVLYGWPTLDQPRGEHLDTFFEEVGSAAQRLFDGHVRQRFHTYDFDSELVLGAQPLALRYLEGLAPTGRLLNMRSCESLGATAVRKLTRSEPSKQALIDKFRSVARAIDAETGDATRGVLLEVAELTGQRAQGQKFLDQWDVAHSHLLESWRKLMYDLPIGQLQLETFARSHELSDSASSSGVDRLRL